MRRVDGRALLSLVFEDGWHKLIAVEDEDLEVAAALELRAGTKAEVVHVLLPSLGHVAPQALPTNVVENLPHDHRLMAVVQGQAPQIPS